VPGVTVGVRLPHEAAFDAARLREFVAHVDDTPIERVFVGDHVSFRDGTGFDGLQFATAIAALSSRVTVQTAVYLLPLRHPVPVARQVAGLGWLAPRRFVFGVGVGGEDPAEVRACGVDPALRGRRLDEALPILRELLAGRAVTHTGRSFQLDEVTIAPAPPQPVPIVVGGRSTAALRRTARLGDGWLATWVSPQRYAAACEEIAAFARAAGREVASWRHGLHVWCGFGADRDSARRRLAGEMESLYGVPFEKFERYCPYGSPDDVADALRPYLAAGCRSVNLIATAESSAAALAGAVAVRELLRES
jgi:alkanesulfonate monooxygenase SsuD/methylene tetrahydromethanopterin reductase-like flavin-dependent oxidoreductase (luciferase family)